MAVSHEKIEKLVSFAGSLEVNNKGTGGSKVYKESIDSFIAKLTDEQLSLLADFILDGLRDGEAKRTFTKTLGANSLEFRTLLADIKSQINLLNSKPEYERYYRTFGLIEYLQEKRPELIEESQKIIESVKNNFNSKSLKKRNLNDKCLFHSNFVMSLNMKKSLKHTIEY